MCEAKRRKKNFNRKNCASHESVIPKFNSSLLITNFTLCWRLMSARDIKTFSQLFGSKRQQQQQQDRANFPPRRTAQNIRDGEEEKRESRIFHRPIAHSQRQCCGETTPKHSEETTKKKEENISVMHHEDVILRGGGGVGFSQPIKSEEEKKNFFP